MKILIVESLEKLEFDFIKKFIKSGNVIISLSYSRRKTTLWNLVDELRKEVNTITEDEDKVEYLKSLDKKLFISTDNIFSPNISGESTPIYRNALSKFDPTSKNLELILQHLIELGNKISFNDIYIDIDSEEMKKSHHNLLTYVEVNNGNIISKKDELLNDNKINYDNLLNTKTHNKNLYVTTESTARTEVDVLFTDLNNTIVNENGNEIVINPETEQLNFESLKKFVESGNVLVIVTGAHGEDKCQLSPNKKIIELFDSIDEKFLHNIFFFKNRHGQCRRIRSRIENVEQKKRRLNCQLQYLKNKEHDSIEDYDLSTFSLMEVLPLWYENKVEAIFAMLDYLRYDGYIINNIYGAGDSIGSDGEMLKLIEQNGGYTTLINTNSEEEYQIMIRKHQKTFEARNNMFMKKSLEYGSPLEAIKNGVELPIQMSPYNPTSFTIYSTLHEFINEKIMDIKKTNQKKKRKI